jgi:methylglutamate dehydrogenase subunit B
MRIPCPLCGAREHGEFTYLGDATMMARPDPNATDAARQFHEYMHLRSNPAGIHKELWYHDAGCRSWLVVTRDTINHQISAVERAEDIEART